MTRKAKIAVTLPQELVDAANRAVREGRAASVSAYVAESMEQRVQAGGLAELLDELLEATGGPMSDAGRDDADQKLGWTEH